jgi:hypothetical protein
MTDLRERFERDLADLHPTPGFEASVVSRGRRLRARRRGIRTVGALVATAAVGTVLVSLLGGADGTTSEDRFATDPPPAPPAETAESPTGWWDMPARRMLTELEAMLPAGVTVARADLTSDGLDGPMKAIGSLFGVLDAATGPGTFQVLLYPPDPVGPLPEAVTSTDAEGNDVTVVAAAGQSNGSRIACRAYMTTCEPLLDGSGQVAGRLSTDTDQGTTYYEAALLGPDGGALYAYVADSTGEKPGYESPTASVPPLTLEQLRDLVTDAAWTAWEAPAGR